VYRCLSKGVSSFRWLWFCCDTCKDLSIYMQFCPDIFEPQRCRKRSLLVRRHCPNKSIACAWQTSTPGRRLCSSPEGVYSGKSTDRIWGHIRSRDSSLSRGRMASSVCIRKIQPSIRSGFPRFMALHISNLSSCKYPGRCRLRKVRSMTLVP
jgi:hypothetical protein